MKILHIIESLDLGGAEKVVSDLISFMPETASSVVCCLKKSGVMAKQLPAGTPVIELLSARGNDFTLPGKIAKTIKDNHIDIVHAHNWNTFIEANVGSWLANSVPLVHTIHGPYSDYSSGVISFLKKRLRRVIERQLAKKCCKICTVSDAIKEYTVSHLALTEAQIDVVINGVNTDHNHKSSMQVRQALNLSSKDIVLCFVGRLAQIKNLQYLLLVLPLLMSIVPNIKVLLVGDGPEQESLKLIVEQNELQKVVQFLGFQEYTSDYLHCADIFVLPSLYEGISVALLEAMAAGLPAVVNDVGGNSQLVIEGKTGHLVPPNDADSFLAALVSLSVDSEKRNLMSINARERVCSKFSLSSTVDQYLKIYHACLDGQAR